MSGPVEVVSAATIVCLRQRPALPSDDSATSRASWSQWDVLLGQSEVKNWLRSTADSTRIMRYPGEWKFPGGVVDDCDTSLEATALRELQEEFLGIPATKDNAKVYFLGDKTTKIIQRRRHRMFNFVSFQEENSIWLNDDEVERVNVNLAQKRQGFEQLLADDTFWMLSEEEKMCVSPEIHRVQWFPIDVAMTMMAATLMDPFTPIDDWQKQQFDLYNVRRRDPMYISLRILMDIVAFQNPDALKQYVQRQAPPAVETVRVIRSSSSSGL